MFVVFSTLDPFRASSQLQAVQCRICPFPVIVQVVYITAELFRFNHDVTVKLFVKLTFISVDEILSFYNSNKTSLTELLDSFIYGFYLLKRNLIFFL